VILSGQTSLSTKLSRAELPDAALNASSIVDFPVPLPPMIHVRFLLNLTTCPFKKPPSNLIPINRGIDEGIKSSILTRAVASIKAILIESYDNVSILSFVSFLLPEALYPRASNVCASENKTLAIS